MRFSTPYALAASMLVSQTVAVHAGHQHQHKRDLVVVTDNEEVYETLVENVVVDAAGNAYSTAESTVLTTVDSGVASASSAPAAAVSTAVAATTEAPAVTSAAAVVDDAAASGTVIVATYNGEVFSWTTTFGAAATPAAAEAAVSSVAAASTSEASSTYVAPSSTYVAPSSTYVAPSSSASPTTLATSYAASSSSVYSSSAAASSSAVASSSAAATSSAASSTSTASSSSSSTGHRGLSYNDASLTDAFEGSSEVGWAYNWGQTSEGLSSNFEFIPMLWGLSDSETSSWESSVSTALAAGSSHLLAFNEPDYTGESDISAADAAAGYKTYMNPYSGSAKLGAPAVTNGGAPMGLTWLESFLTECADECTIDFVPIHWYDSATNYEYFKEYVQEAYVAGGNRTLWITEMGATGSTDEQNTFLQVVMPWLDSLDYVERYAYFMCEDGVLISGTSLSTLGSTYSSYVSSIISSLISAV